MEYKKDNKQNKNQEKTIEKLENKIVFNNNDSYRFVFKKHERLVAGLYLITNLFGDTEPLKWKIRTAALEALSRSLTLTQVSQEDKSVTIAACAGAITELMSLCQVAHVAQYISAMNYAILQREFSIILEALEGLSHRADEQKTAVLSSDFFSVPEPLMYKKTSMQNKGHGLNTEGQFGTVGDYVGSESDVRDNKKMSRRETIVSMLQNSKTLAVKDFTSEIKDCSEKTIQRELLALVDEGVLNKIGERRWSVYSLK